MDSKEDEEMSIDFSKIKNFFKSKKEEPKAQEATQHSSVKEEKEDEEISIDFGKIKSFFKSDKKEEPTEQFSKKDDEELDLSFDFGKVKKFFKSGEKESVHDEEISINWSRIIDFFKKYGIVFIALIPIILSVYIRMQAGSLPFTDDWAANSVINSMKSQISAGVNQQYPNLPDANKNEIINRELQKVISQNKAQIDQQIKATSQYFKAFFQDENGKNYMPDIDPYYWFRYAKNIVEHGYPGDVLKDGKSFDNHQRAPVGRFLQPDMFHVYFLAYFYKFLHFFVPDLTIMRSIFYYPVFVSALCVLLVFLIARKIAGNLGGFFAGLMIAVNAAFLGRTLFGHADNDAWVVFFPLLVTWLFLVSIDVKSTVGIILLSVLAGFFTGVFTFAWNGWWYIFDFLLATMFFMFLYLVFTNFNGIKGSIKSLFYNTAIRNLLIIAIIYFLSTALFATLFSDWVAFRTSFLGPLKFQSIKAPVDVSLWPNVLTTVAELNEGSINAIINSIGGYFLFFIGLIGLLLAISGKDRLTKFDIAYLFGGIAYYGAFVYLTKTGFVNSMLGVLIGIMLPIAIRLIILIYKKDPSYDFKLPILLSLWIISTIFASIKGIRFTLLLAPAFSVAFGVALGKGYLYILKLLTKELKVHKAIGSSILIISLLFIFYINPTRGAINAASSDLPIVNDAWYNALIAIKQDSSKNAIITSWWDFGHHFKAIADRRVTFDGTTQTLPASHWVGKLLMTDNETRAVGILRMLDCGSNNAFNELYKINNDTHLSIRILNKLIVLDRKGAEKELKGLKLDEKQIEKILSFTHCDAPEAYFIASEDMIGKSGVWSHFGSWNFERADIWQNARNLPQEKSVDYMMKKFNYTKERADNIYFEIQSIENEPDANKRDSQANAWVAPWPGYGGTASCSKNEKGIYICQPYKIGTDNSGRDIYVNFNVNLSNYDVFALLGNNLLKPSLTAFTTEKGLFVKDVNGSNLGFGITFVPINENELQAIVSSKELTGGMFTRMFYMQGHGLKYFKLFNHQRGLTGTNIYIYKVDWEGKNTTIVKEYADYLRKPVETESTTEDTNLELNKNTNITNNS